MTGVVTCPVCGENRLTGYTCHHCFPYIPTSQPGEVPAVGVSAPITGGADLLGLRGSASGDNISAAAVPSTALTAPAGEGLPAGVRADPWCPGCGRQLDRVKYPGGSLNRDQWESVRAGDWWCGWCRDNGRGKSGAYYWDNEVITAAPVAPRHPDPSEIRAALTCKDALLRRALTVLQAIRLVEPDIRPGANHIELVGAHLGTVTNLCVAIEIELSIESPLEVK